MRAIRVKTQPPTRLHTAPAITFPRGCQRATTYEAHVGLRAFCCSPCPLQPPVLHAPLPCVASLPRGYHVTYSTSPTTLLGAWRCAESRLVHLQQSQGLPTPISVCGMECLTPKPCTQPILASPPPPPPFASTPLKQIVRPPTHGRTSHSAAAPGACAEQAGPARAPIPNAALTHTGCDSRQTHAAPPAALQLCGYLQLPGMLSRCSPPQPRTQTLACITPLCGTQCKRTSCCCLGCLTLSSPPSKPASSTAPTSASGVTTAGSNDTWGNGNSRVYAWLSA